MVPDVRHIDAPVGSAAYPDGLCLSAQLNGLDVEAAFLSAHANHGASHVSAT